MSRWLLCGGMMLFAVHYLLQMTQGFRARGSDVGALFNILFYTPAAFLITISIINMESTVAQVRRYSLRSAAAFLPVAILFNTQLLYVGPLMLFALVFFVHSFISLGYYAALYRGRWLKGVPP